MPDSDTLSGNYEQSGNMFTDAAHSASEDFVRRSYFGAKNDAEAARRLAAERRLDAYEDDFATALKARISNSGYHPDNAKKLYEVIDVTNNPLKRIVNEMSTLYTKQPVRTLSDSKATLLWRDLIRRANGSVVFPRVNRLTNLLNTMLVYVRPCYDGLTLKLVLPQDATVWPDPDDPTMPLAVEFVECDPAAPNAKPTYHVWDRREGDAGYREFDADRKMVRQLPNPYFDSTGRQIIPLFAVHREWPAWSFWDQTSGNDLYELTLMVGMWETWINYLIKTDSARQKWVSGEVDNQGEQVGGPENLLKLVGRGGQPVSIGEFSSQSDWNGLGAQIKRKLENVLNNVGLVLPDTRTSGDPTSGFALVIRSQGLRKIQEAQKPSYEKTEETFYRVFSTVHNFERTNPQFPAMVARNLPALPPVDAAEPRVEFADVETLRTVEERAAELDMADKRIKMGLASPVTIYMEQYPEATEEEARAAIEKNLADTEALKKAPMEEPRPPGAPAGGPPPQPSEDSENADQDEEGGSAGA